MAFFKLLPLMTVTSAYVAFAEIPACVNEQDMGYDDPENQQPSLFLADAQACQNACIAYCHVFTFYPKNIWHPNSTLGGCYLQGDAAVLKSLKGAVSGPKSCATTTPVADTTVVETTAAAAVEETPTAAAAEETPAPPAAVETPAPPAAAAAAVVVAPAASEVTTAEVTTAEPTTTTPLPPPTSAEEAALQAVGKLHPYAPLGMKSSTAAGAAASYAFAEGKSKEVIAEGAEKAAKVYLVDANDTTHQIMVNHMAEAVGKVYANKTMFNMTDTQAADATQKSVQTFADEIYAKPAAALAAVNAAGASISLSTGVLPTPLKTASTESTAAPEETTTEAAAAIASKEISITDDETEKTDKKSEGGGIPPWVWILIALAVLACLAGAYMFLCAGSSKDKKKKTKKTAPKDVEAARPVEAAPLMRDVQETSAREFYTAPAVAASPGGLPAGSIAQGMVMSQGSPMYSPAAGGYALPQGSPVSGSNIVMMPQAVPAFTVAPPVYVGQAQPMMMQGGMSVASQPFAQAPMGMSVASQPYAQPAGASAAMDLFNRLDANGDGQLSAQEFAQLQAMQR